MQTRVRLFNRQGIPIGEVASPNVTRQIEVTITCWRCKGLNVMHLINRQRARDAA